MVLSTHTAVRYITKTSTEKNIRKNSVQSRVAVTCSESMKCGSNCNILENCHRLAVGCEHRRVVIVISYSNFYMCRVYVTWIGVLYIHGHIEEWMKHRIIVHRLQHEQHTVTINVNTCSLQTGSTHLSLSKHIHGMPKNTPPHDHVLIGCKINVLTNALKN